MKQSTKVLLPLGLFMSVIIPVTVKSLFIETDLFESSDSGAEYMQPYTSKPEDLSNLPKVRIGENGLEVEINQPVTTVTKATYKDSKSPNDLSISSENDFGSEKKSDWSNQNVIK